MFRRHLIVDIVEVRLPLAHVINGLNGTKLRIHMHIPVAALLRVSNHLINSYVVPTLPSQERY